QNITFGTNSLYAIGAPSNAAATLYTRMVASDDSQNLDLKASGLSQLRLWANGTNWWTMNLAGTLFPVSSNVNDLGGPSNQLRSGFSGPSGVTPSVVMNGGPAASDTPLIRASQIWNGSGTAVFTGFLMNVTDAGSAPTSRFVDWRVNGDSKFAVMKNGDVATAGVLTGSGAGLSNLNATQLATGTVPSARLGSNVPLTDAANLFTAPQTFAGGFAVAGPLRVPDGSAAAPGLAFSAASDNNSGLYRIADRQAGFAIDGKTISEWNA